MSFGQNLQFLRKMHQGMTQEELAEKMGVSRQTISKWEMDTASPEMEKAIMLCNLFSCTLDGLMRENIYSDNEAYTSMRVETVAPFKYVRYAVISADPENDAMNHIKEWAGFHGIENPQIIGWDFPFLSQEQINVFHMHGYTAACIVTDDFAQTCCDTEIIAQSAEKYAIITIKDPFSAAFFLIPNAYKTLARYIEVNGKVHKQSKDMLPCFEKVYEKDSVIYMDVYIAVE